MCLSVLKGEERDDIQMSRLPPGPLAACATHSGISSYSLPLTFFHVSLCAALKLLSEVSCPHFFPAIPMATRLTPISCMVRKGSQVHPGLGSTLLT